MGEPIEGFRKRKRTSRPIRGDHNRAQTAKSFVVRLTSKAGEIGDFLTLLEDRGVACSHPRCLPTGQITLAFEGQEQYDQALALFTEHSGDQAIDKTTVEPLDGKIYEEYYDASHARVSLGLQLDPSPITLLQIIRALRESGVAIQEPYTLESGAIRMFAENESDLQKVQEVLGSRFPDLVVQPLSALLLEPSGPEEDGEEADETDPLAIVIEGKATLQEVVDCVAAQRVVLASAPQSLPGGSLRLLTQNTFDKASALLALTELFQERPGVKVVSPLVGPGRLLTRKLATLAQAVQEHGVRSFDRMYIVACRLQLNLSLSRAAAVVTRSDNSSNGSNNGALVLLPHFKTFADICSLALGVKGRDRFVGPQRARVEAWMVQALTALTEIPRLWAVADGKK